MAKLNQDNMQCVSRSAALRMKPVACAVIGAIAMGLISVTVPKAATAQSEATSAEVQLVLEKNKELLNTLELLTDRLGISPGDNPWADYQQKIESLQAELGDVRGRLGLAERRMAQHASLVDNLRTQHAERVEQLQRQLVQASNALDAANEDSGNKLAEAQAEASVLSDEINGLRAMEKSREARLSDLKSQLLQTITSKNAAQVAQQKQLDESQSDAQAALADVVAKQKQIDGLRAELGSANIRVKKLSAQLTDGANLVASQKDELSAVQKTNDQLLQQLNNRTAVVKRQDKGISRLLAKLDAARDELLADNEAAQQREVDLVAEITQLQSDMAANKSLQRDLRMNNRSMQAAYRKSDEKAGLLGIELNHVNSQLAAANEQQSVLQAHLDETRELADAAKARNRDFKKQIAQIQMELEKAGGENTRLNRLVQQSSEEAAQLNAMMAESFEQGAALQQELEQVNVNLLAARNQEMKLAGLLDDARRVAEQAKSRNRDLKGQLTQATGDLELLGSEKNQLAGLNSELTTRLADSGSELAERTEEVEALQTNVDKLKQSLADLQRGNDDVTEQLVASREKGEALEKHLVELRNKVTSPREAALALRNQVGQKLKEQGIENTVLGIRADNSVTFKIPNELLFVSGSARLNKNGRTLMQQVGNALNETDDSVMVRIEGHTDSVPVAEKFRHIFPSNWFLSVSRAANAVDFLHTQAGMEPTRLSATGFGEFKPLASNETVEGRNRNRRVEIILMPDTNADQAGS